MRITTHDVGCEIQADGQPLADCPVEQVAGLLGQHGYVYFTGFSPSVAEFEDFTSRFGVCANTREVHYPDSGAGLGFHAEDAYNPYRPDALWFLCVFAGSDGGVPTSVVDGIELLDAMPAEWSSFCRSNAIKFDRQWSAKVWQTAAEVPDQAALAAELSKLPGVEHQFLSDDSLHISCQVPLVSRTADGRESFANTLLQAVTDPDFYGLSLADGSAIPEGLLVVVEELARQKERAVGWTTGDLAVIDNLRMMHRRGEYHQKDRNLRARHCENLFGSQLPADHSELQQWIKSLIQADIALPDRVGPPAVIGSEQSVAGPVDEELPA